MTDFDEIFKGMAEKWPSNVVARKAISDFTGGILSPKTMANNDSLGQGIEDRFMLCNQVVYPIDSLGAWMKQHYSKSWKDRERH